MATFTRKDDEAFSDWYIKLKKKASAWAVSKGLSPNAVLVICQGNYKATLGWRFAGTECDCKMATAAEIEEMDEPQMTAEELSKIDSKVLPPEFETDKTVAVTMFGSGVLEEWDKKMANPATLQAVQTEKAKILANGK